MNKHQDTVRYFSKVLILCYLSILAFFSVFTHTSKAFGLSFHRYSIFGTIVSVSIFLLFVFLIYKIISEFNIHLSKLILILVLIGILCSFLALISYRVDTDDYLYLPNVVYFTQNPNQTMDYKIHFVDGGDGCEIVSHSWGTSSSFELFQGALSYSFHIDYLSFYYFINAALISFLIPFALYYPLSFFSKDKINNVLGVFFSLFVIFLLGETHRTYGNFSITRAYQGKTFLLAVGVPYFFGVVLDFLASDKKKNNYIVALITITALAGVSSTSLVLLPLIFIFLTGAYICAFDLNKKKLLSILKFSAAFGYLIFYGIYLFYNSGLDLGLTSPVNINYPSDFQGNWNLMFNKNKPVTQLVVLMSTVGTMVFVEKEHRKFFLFYIFFVFVFVLNPVAAPIIIKYITTPNIYWRLFYIFPWFLFIPLSFILISRMIRKTDKNWLYVVLIFLLLSAYPSPYFMDIFDRTNSQIPFSYKLPFESIKHSQHVIASAPDGTMLSPADLSETIPLYSSRHPQVRTTNTAIRLWLERCGKRERVARNRIGASNFVGGRENQYQYFVDFLEDEGTILTSVVIHESVLSKSVSNTLAKYGFNQVQKHDVYYIYYR